MYGFILILGRFFVLVGTLVWLGGGWVCGGYSDP